MYLQHVYVYSIETISEDASYQNKERSQCRLKYFFLVGGIIRLCQARCILIKLHEVFSLHLAIYRFPLLSFYYCK